MLGQDRVRRPSELFRCLRFLEVSGTATEQGLEDLANRVRGSNCPPTKQVGWIERGGTVALLGIIFDADQEPYRPPQLWEFAK